jgi:hypothetical protein
LVFTCALSQTADLQAFDEIFVWCVWCFSKQTKQIYYLSSSSWPLFTVLGPTNLSGWLTPIPIGIRTKKAIFAEIFSG